MPRFAEESKTPMSNPAKVLLAYMRLSGQWDSRALAAEFDVPLRTIQRWKMECAASATDATGAIFGVPLVHGHNATRATDATDGAPQAPDLALARDLQRAHANMEYPSGILIPREVDSPLVPQAVETAPVASPSAQPTQRVRGTRLNSDWTLPVEWRQWAEINTQLGPDGITLEADKFRDHWVAKAGAGSTKLDWMATWRNWCRTAGSRRPMNWGRNAYDEAKAKASTDAKPMTLREALNRRIAEQERAAA
jgi:hypothetical protein